MKSTCFTAAALLLGGLVATAQKGLREIPNPEVAVQMAAFKLPEGARINLFASEPMISKPVHMNWDTAGRLWVVGSPLYPHIKPGEPESDKIYVLEDTDGDGAADKSTVFADDLYIPTAVLPGDGGVYTANSTEILFLRDTDGDGVADERRPVLSGFGTEDTHHLVHTLRWGPGGAMWFNQSIYIHSHLETPFGVRRLMAGGMWQFRPESGRAEIFMRGLINPWGHAFDDFGQSFMSDGAGGDGVNFVFPGATFRTAYEAPRILRGLNPGQPKHCGLEVVTGRHAPEEWVGSLLAPDFRGHRINRFKLSDKGSSYVSTQVEDLVASSHRAFRPIDVKMGPDGAIYVADWYNPIIQHGEVDFRDPRRDHKHGRIWRITFDGRDPVAPPAIAGADAPSLVKLLDSPEGLTRGLVATELRGREAGEVMPILERWYASLGEAAELQKLRALWASQAIGAPRRDWAGQLVAAKSHKVRAGALRVLYDLAFDTDVERSLLEKAVADPHPQVRLWAVRVLSQLDWPDTVAVALRALEGVEVDEFLDFAVWSICREHSNRWLPAAEKGNPFATVQQLLFAARAIGRPVGMNGVLAEMLQGKLGDADWNAAVAWVADTGNANQLRALYDLALAQKGGRQAQLLGALTQATQLRKVRPAGDLGSHVVLLAQARGELFGPAARLAGLWRLEAARPILEEAARAPGGEAGRVRAAMEGLRALGGPKTQTFLTALAGDEEAPFHLRALAVGEQTRLNPAAGAQLAIPLLQRSPGDEQTRLLVDAFLANKRGPGALQAALEAPGVTLPAAVAVAGMNRAASAATKPQGLVKAFRMAGGLQPMKLQLTDAEMEAMKGRVAGSGDAHRGEKIYRRASLQCVVCHAIGGAGGVIGPDLVSIGASAPVDYLVESLLEPSKKIKEGYHTTLVTTKGGDTVAGAVARESENELVIRDATGVERRIAKNDIASTVVSPVSLMPPGLTASLREDEFVDLVRFLSELGREGEFKTTANRYVRHWEALQPHERIRDDIGHYGQKLFAEDDKTFVWKLIVPTVSGKLPVGELPRMTGRGKARYGVARFLLEVSKPGPVEMTLEGKLKDLWLFAGEKEVATPKSGNTARVRLDLPAGRHRITVAGWLDQGLEDVRVELLGNAGAARVVQAGK